MPNKFNEIIKLNILISASGNNERFTLKNIFIKLAGR